MNENQNSLKDKVKETAEKGKEKVNQTRQSSAYKKTKGAIKKNDYDYWFSFSNYQGFHCFV